MKNLPSTAPSTPNSEVDLNSIIPQKVAIVDDELYGMSYSHLDTACIALFEDRNSPEFAELWRIAQHINGFAEFDKEDQVKIREFFTSDELVSKVILSQYFHDTATATLKDPLANFLNRSARIKTLRGHIEQAFPAPQFILNFYESRPDTKELLACDLLILDLVLTKSTKAIDEAVEYLKRLGDEAGANALPPIILMSGHPELLNNKRLFSTRSNISAAGLLILPKDEVASENFASPGLLLTYHQLSKQKNVAYRMRAFMLSWTAALEAAREKAATTLWNLDAAAMQQIHFTAVSDNDPYDEHLNELIAREYLWHVESNPTVGNAIDELDNCFREQFDSSSGPSIQHRFIAPFVEPENNRSLLSHFTWTGWAKPASFIDLSADDATRQFNRLVPFGALLIGKDFISNAECLVHITQQCDLNTASRNPASIQTSIFAVVQAIEVVPHKIPSHTTQDLVARNLKVNDKEYDFKLLKGRMLALPIAEFLKYAKEKGLNVAGRLRHDIATHFMQATVNHLTRPASQAMERVSVVNAKLYLHGNRFQKKQSAFLDFATVTGQGQKKAKIVQLTKDDTTYNFQNDESIRIALWIQSEFKKYYAKDSDASALCSALRVGCREGQKLVNAIDLKFLESNLDEAWKTIKTISDPGDGVNLVIVTERKE